MSSIRNYSKHDHIPQKRKNVVNRQFSAERPDQIWVGDIAEFMVKGIYYYICVIIDLFSRKVVGYKVSSRCSTKLLTTTFKSAFAARGKPAGLIFHSDQGTQYTSTAFRQLLTSYGVTQSFSYRGRPRDNAVAESFFANLKREELYRHEYRSEREFRKAVSECWASSASPITALRPSSRGASSTGKFNFEVPAHMISHVARLAVDPENCVIMHSRSSNLLAMTYVHLLEERTFTRTLVTDVHDVYHGLLLGRLLAAMDALQNQRDRRHHCPKGSHNPPGGLGPAWHLRRGPGHGRDR